MFYLNRIVLVLLLVLIVSSLLSICFQAYGLIWFSRNDYHVSHNQEWVAMDNLGMYEGNTLIYEVHDGIQLRPVILALAASVVSFLLSLSYFVIVLWEIRQSKHKITRTWAHVSVFLCALLTAGLAITAFIATQFSARPVGFTSPDGRGYVSLLEETSLDAWICYLSNLGDLYVIDSFANQDLSGGAAIELEAVCNVTNAGRWITVPCTVFAVLICAAIAWNWWLRERGRQQDSSKESGMRSNVDCRDIYMTS